MKDGKEKKRCMKEKGISVSEGRVKNRRVDVNKYRNLWLVVEVEMKDKYMGLSKQKHQINNPQSHHDLHINFAKPLVGGYGFCLTYGPNNLC